MDNTVSKNKQVLGRGLDALINASRTPIVPNLQTGTLSGTSASGSIQKIPVKLISPNPFQPRLEFEPEALEELKKSILKNGLIQPITVRKYGDGYQVISGERRLRAFTDIGYQEIPAYILDVVSDELMLAMALIENIQRENLNPVEVALAYKRLLDECKLTQEEIAERVGKDRSTVTNTLRLLKLPEEIKLALSKGELTMGHARALINIPEKNIQLEIYRKIVANHLPVRKVESLVKNYLTGKDISGGSKSKNKSLGHANTSVQMIEDRLRRLFGTKVTCKLQNNGQGEITLEFYSKDELERLLDLFDEIEKNVH